MIIEARDDVLTLSGSLDKNLWPSIESAAGLLLRLHPRGILIDASGLTNITSEGAKTFLDGMAYIERYRARIVLCRVPGAALDVIRNIPGVRSQVPISATCEEARTSLELAAAARERTGRGKRATSPDGKPRNVLVPLLNGSGSPREAVALALLLGTVSVATDPEEGAGRSPLRPQITLSYILQVPRTMPLNAPSPEEEEVARAMLQEAQDALAAMEITAQTDVARTRDIDEEIIAQAQRTRANLIVLTLPESAEQADSPFEELVASLLSKSPCEVVLRR